MHQSTRTALRQQRWFGLTIAVLLVAGVTALVVQLTTNKEGPPFQPLGTGPGGSVPSFHPGDVTASEAALLKGRVGFGGKVTGGAGGDIAHVTTSADSGAGSLRAAVSGGAGHRWVVFDKDMTIALGSTVELPSNTTLDGRGHKVTLTGHGVTGLTMEKVSNVIIENLTLRDFGDTTKTDKNDPDDAIHMDGTTGVWIDHCDLSDTGDKLIAVSEGSSGITVSWNHFHDQEQVFQVGNQATATVDAKQTVTVDHNFFDHTGYRNPVVSYGTAHVYNNYFLDWKTYAVRSQRRASVYLENNIFDAGANNRASIVKPSGNGCNDNKTRCDSSSGYLRSVGNLVVNGAKIIDNNPTHVVSPSTFYRYSAQPANQALETTLKADTGPRS